MPSGAPSGAFQGRSLARMRVRVCVYKRYIRKLFSNVLFSGPESSALKRGLRGGGSIPGRTVVKFPIGSGHRNVKATNTSHYGFLLSNLSEVPLVRKNASASEAFFRTWGTYSQQAWLRLVPVFPGLKEQSP